MENLPINLLQKRLNHNTELISDINSRIDNFVNHISLLNKEKSEILKEQDILFNSITLLQTGKKK